MQLNSCVSEEVRLGSKVNLTSWVSEEVRLEKGLGGKGTGREETAKRANEKGGRRRQKSAKRGHLPMGNTKKVFFDSCLHSEGFRCDYHR